MMPPATLEKVVYQDESSCTHTKTLIPHALAVPYISGLHTMLCCNWFSALAGIGMQTKCYHLSDIFMSLSIKKLEHPNFSK